MPKISVVIPLYNKGPHIKRALGSILAQSVTDLDVVVIDDGSTDNGAHLVEQVKDSRIRLLRQENRGVSAARNRGIREAQSDLIAFLDADDEWEPDHLETLLFLHREFPEAGAFTTAYKIFEDNGKASYPNFAEIPSAPWSGLIPNYIRSAALGSPPVWTSAVAVPRSVFDQVGLFVERINMGEDLDMWLRIALKYPIAFSWQGIAVYRRDSKNRLCAQWSADYSLIIERCRSVLESGESRPLEEDLRLFLRKFGRAHIRSLLLQGENKAARKTIRTIRKTLESFVFAQLELCLSYLPKELLVKILKLRHCEIQGQGRA